MKRFTKIALVCAVTCAAAGLGLAAAGIAMGAVTDGRDVLSEVFDNAINSENFHYSVSVLDDRDWDDFDDWNDREPSDNTNGNQGYSFEKLSDLDIELTADELYLKSYDGNGIRVEVSDNDDKVRVKQDGNTLKIKSLSKLNGTQISVYYPETMEFGNVDIEVDAGNILVEDTFKVRELDIQVGAGELTANDVISAQEVQLDVGAGEMNLAVLDAFSMEAECGVGSLEIGLTGSESEYSYKVECGLGRVVVGDQTYSGISETARVENAGAARKMELECGLGDVQISFEK